VEVGGVVARVVGTLTTRAATSWVGAVVSTGAATVVGTGAVVVVGAWVVGPEPPRAPSVAESAPDSEASVTFDRGSPGCADATGWRPTRCPGAGDAAASGPLWIKRSGTMSTAPHRNRAAPGRLPFLILVLRTPLSLWD
jgi:hypothetical protein